MTFRSPAEELRAERRAFRRRRLMRMYRKCVPFRERVRRAWATLLGRKPKPGLINIIHNS